MKSLLLFLFILSIITFTSSILISNRNPWNDASDKFAMHGGGGSLIELNNDIENSTQIKRENSDVKIN